MSEYKRNSDRLRSRRSFLKAAGVGGAISVAALKGASPALSTPGPAEPSATRPKGLPFELGIASYTFRKFELDDTIAMTKRVGIRHICLKSFHLPLESTPEEIARVREKVTQAGLVLYGGGVINMGNEKQVAEAFEYAKAAGMTTIVGVPAPEILPLVSQKVEAYDIKVAIHNHGPGDKVYPTPESAYEKIKDLDPRIGLCVDVGHTIRVGADPIRSVEKCRGSVLDVHLKDVTAAQPEGREIEVGRGIIDIPGILKALLASGFSGIASFEYEKDPTDPLAGLAESVGFVRGVLAAI